MATEVYIINAVRDKETKNAYRFNVEDNDFDVRGTLYLPKTIVGDKIAVKIKVEVKK